MLSQGSTLPKHVAVIMDGNGRWAERRGRPRIFGHIRGCSRVRELIREADHLGIKALTLYAFSIENWGRPAPEVSILMRLLRKWLAREQKELMEKNIRFRAIGCLEQLPFEIQELVKDTESMSSANTGLQLTLALSYSAREEILEATRKIAQRVLNGEIIPEEISESDFAQELTTLNIGDPDLLIRTSGELRVSNFLLWQLAYTELYFTDTLWPDFRASDFKRALDGFARRQRRFGLISMPMEIRA